MEYPLHLISPIDHEVSLRFSRFPNDNYVKKGQRLSQFTIIWIQEGEGHFLSDFLDLPLTAGCLLFLEPEQPFSIQGASISGTMVNCHPDFFYTIKQQSEVTCDHLIFNRDMPYPPIQVTKKESATFRHLFNEIEQAIITEAAGQFDLLVAYLKILVIQAIRIKLRQKHHKPLSASLDVTYQAKVIRRLKAAIDAHYRELHNPGEYAALLNIAVKSLGRIVKEHCEKTLTSLISDRIMLEARRELYLTDKPIKEIAFELGFGDEYHFSKYFKNKIGHPPTLYRNILRYGADHSLKLSIDTPPHPSVQQIQFATAGKSNQFPTLRG